VQDTTGEKHMRAKPNLALDPDMCGKPLPSSDSSTSAPAAADQKCQKNEGARTYQISGNCKLKIPRLRRNSA